MYDLVNIPSDNEVLRIATYFVLRNTLVTKDLPTAKKISFNNGNSKRYKVAAMDGSVVFENGSISGGGKAQTGAINTDRTTTQQSSSYSGANIQQL